MDPIAEVDTPRDAELADALRLSLIPGVGPRTTQSLLKHFGSITAALAASRDELERVHGVGSKLAAAICAARSEIDVEAELEACRRQAVDVIPTWHGDYPRLLSQITDPPPLIYVRGKLAPGGDQLAVAIVGSRHATNYGREQAQQLAGSLARAGLTIVSGLARGVDAAAHRGAIEAGGRTLAVLGSGLGTIYPPEHAELADEVAAHGALVSELPIGALPRSGTFPQRNRLISGMSLGVIVVEASDRSGALITARHAAEQNREVFAVPGRVDQRNSRGCHRLIRDGAKLVESADDVLEELGPLFEPALSQDGREVRHPAELKLNDLERQVLDAIDSEPTLIDGLVASSGLATGQVLATLSALEVRRLIRRVGGNLVSRV